MNERVGTSNYDLAYIDYCNGMKYKDIAEKYGVTINTVKSWKTRYKWSKGNEKSVHTKIKNVCTQKNTKEKAAAKEVEQVMKNPELTGTYGRQNNHNNNILCYAHEKVPHNYPPKFIELIYYK